MIALIQRVSEAQVRIDDTVVAHIGRGILAMIGIRPDDDADKGARLLGRLLGYRIFADVDGKMNLDLGAIGGDLLLVPQFTLAADTTRGLRPGFSTAAHPDLARPLFEGLVLAAQARHPRLASGVFGADMQVSLVNDGPATFWLESG